MNSLLRRALLLGLCLPFTLTACAAERVSRQARALHQRILVLDSHLDTPAQFDDPHWNILEEHAPTEGDDHVDYPRMQAGGLDGGLWVVYTPQRSRGIEANRIARDHGLKRLIGIKQLLAAHPDKFELALTPEDAPRIAKAGKRVVYIAMENAAPLAGDPSLLQFYYDQGLRVLGIVHTSHNDFADSANVAPEWGGLSPRGRALVETANRMGILLDQSHASDAVFDQLLELSKSPIILTHTSADALRDHPRNIDDERIRRLAAGGGVIQVNSYGAYLVDGRAATFEDYMAHVLHILKVAGPDHVGFGADWDGGGGVRGMEDITALPKITQRLLDAGYTEAQIANIWGGNLLRVLGEAQRIGRELTAQAAGK